MKAYLVTVGGIAAGLFLVSREPAVVRDVGVFAGEPKVPARTDSASVASPDVGDVSEPVSGARSGSALRAFEEWTQGYPGTSQVMERDGWVARGRALARERRAELKVLLKEDPERALSLALPLSIRSSLPAEIQAELEERVSGRGDYEVMCVTPLPGKVGEPFVRTVIVAGRRYEAFVYGACRELPTRRAGIW